MTKAKQPAMQTDTSKDTPTVTSTANHDLAQPLLVGIDWADDQHAYAMCDASGVVQRGTVEQTPEAISDLLTTWSKKYPHKDVYICLETSRGPLINALLEHSQVRIFPVNPNALANYRKAFAHGGGKSDPVDAILILQYIKHYRDRLRPLQSNSPKTRELGVLCEDRRRLVEQRVALAQQLKALLKAYFPAILMLKPAKVYGKFVVQLLLKYPTLGDAQKAGRTKLRKLFFGCGTKAKIEQRLDILANAVPLSTDEVLLRTSARRVQAICRQLHALNGSIEAYDKEIEQLIKQHVDYSVISSLPCGVNTQARIIAALGDDRQRYANAAELAATTGIAPLTSQSGQQRHVSSRWACSKFLRQTFHEFAGISITRSRWANAFYKQQLARGKSTHTARRALAYKWLRIIYRCWKNHETYSESKYVARLHATQSPLAKQLPA